MSDDMVVSFYGRVGKSKGWGGFKDPAVVAPATYDPLG